MSVVLNGTSQYLWRIDIDGLGPPFTVSVWFKANNVTALGDLWAQSSSGATDNYWILRAAGHVIGDPLQSLVRDTGSPSIAATTVGYTAGTWHNAVFVEVSTTDHRVYIDGNYVGQTTDLVTPSGVDRMSFGALLYNSTIANHFAGKLAYAALWTTALDTNEIYLLGKGQYPNLIQEDNLLAYWPMYDDAKDATKSSLDLTNSGSATFDTVDIPTVKNFDLVSSVGSTVQLNSMPESKSSFGFEELGGLLYAVCGGTTGGTHSKKVYAYDPSLNSWSAKADAPYACQSPIVRAVSGKLYLIGGYNSNTTTYYDNVSEYDPDLDSWTPKTAMPVAMEDMASAVINGKIYILGGWNAGAGGIQDTVYIYDPVEDSWETKTWSTARCLGDFGAAYNGKIYLVSAVEDMSDYESPVTVTPVTKVDRYDPSTHTFTSLKNCNVAVCYKDVSQVDGMLYVVSGVTQDFGYSSVDQVYDTALNIWKSRKNVSYVAGSIAQVVYNGSIYFAGGWDLDFTNSISALWKHTPVRGDDVSGGSGTLSKGVVSPKIGLRYNILNLALDLDRS